MQNTFSPDQLEAMRVAYQRARQEYPHLPDEEIAHRILRAALKGRMIRIGSSFRLQVS
jgi:hypothetical protein